MFVKISTMLSVYFCILIPSISGVFLLSWTPYAMVSFYVVLGYTDSLHPLLSRSAAFFAKAEVVWNPVIFVVMLNDIKRTVFNLLLCKSPVAVNGAETRSNINITTVRMTTINGTQSVSGINTKTQKNCGLNSTILNQSSTDFNAPASTVQTYHF